MGKFPTIQRCVYEKGNFRCQMGQNGRARCEFFSPRAKGSGIFISVRRGNSYSPPVSEAELRSTLICLKRIYNFRCSMLVLHHLLHVLFTLRGVFM
jgi:hypothetical protein